jgi:hypothetical protein
LLARDANRLVAPPPASVPPRRQCYNQGLIAVVLAVALRWPSAVLSFLEPVHRHDARGATDATARRRAVSWLLVLVQRTQHGSVVLAAARVRLAMAGAGPRRTLTPPGGSRAWLRLR